MKNFIADLTTTFSAWMRSLSKMQEYRGKTIQMVTSQKLH